jgi:Putative Flp pilus-assembly TadE/G-like
MRDLITRFGQRLRRAGADERGAVVILVALLLGFGVLLGMAALVIDVGRIYQERGELQDGADAAAIGVAKSCALGACNPAVAVSYADANASSLTGGTAAAPLICGSDGMALCPGSTGAMIDCPDPPPGGANYVDVHTATQTAGGSTLLPPVFAETLLGNSGYRGTTVHACAQAQWGPPAAATTPAVTVSACEWDQATQQGASFPATPPYPPNQPPAPSADQVLTLTPGNGTGCATEPGGADGPGSFGWVAHPRGNCTAPISGPSFPARMRTSVSFSCLLLLQNAQQNQAPILVPVYVSESGNTYTLLGFADFVVTGYHLLGFDGEYFDAPDWLDSTNDCQGTRSCLNGYFVHGVVPFTGSFGSTDLGVYSIDLTG